MSAKNLDGQGRWRWKTVAFRASAEEADLLDYYVRLSGLSKQDYLLRRVLQKEITVVGNTRVYKALKESLEDVYRILIDISNAGDIEDDLIDLINQINKTLYGLKGGDNE